MSSMVGRSAVLLLVFGIVAVNSAKSGAWREKRSWFGLWSDPAPAPAPAPGLVSGLLGDVDNALSPDIFEGPNTDSVQYLEGQAFDGDSVSLVGKVIKLLSIDDINNGGGTFKAAEYSFFDDDLDLRKLSGSLLDPGRMRKLQLSRSKKIGSISATFDSRTKWPQCKSIAAIQNQDTCASDWAIAATAVMSDRYCIHKNKANLIISTTDLTTCCTKCSKGNGCDGGYPVEAFQFWLSPGIAKQSCRAYSTSRSQTCSKKCGSSTEKYTLQTAQRIYRMDNDVAKIQNEIQNYGPVLASIVVYQDFFSYKSGVYQHQLGSKVGAHSVRIIGWGTENGTPYWLCANSFGSSWGEKGLIKILRGENHLGIEEWVVSALPAEPMGARLKGMGLDDK